MTIALQMDDIRFASGRVSQARLQIILILYHRTTFVVRSHAKTELWQLVLESGCPQGQSTAPLQRLDRCTSLLGTVLSFLRNLPFRPLEPGSRPLHRSISLRDTCLRKMLILTTLKKRYLGREREEEHCLPRMHQRPSKRGQAGDGK